MRPWVADKRAWRGRKRETGGCWAGWPWLAAALVGLAAAASWLGYGRPRGAAALKLSFFSIYSNRNRKRKENKNQTKPFEKRKKERRKRMRKNYVSTSINGH